MRALFTADQLVDILTDYGYPSADVAAVIDSLIESGTEIPPGDDGTRQFTPGELLVLGDALRAGERDRELRD